MFLVNKYMDTFVENLNNNTETLTKKLMEMRTYDFSPEIELLDFVVFMDQSSFSIRMFTMDRDNNEVFKETEDSVLFAGSEGIVSDVEISHISDEHLDEFYSFYEENEEELSSKEEKAIGEWFQNCWKNAAEESINLPAYFVFHDALKSFDLTAWKWIDDKEKWS
ncbi:hypothetical protein [Niallia taxi]|uniref:hypothetical protein n=1 Tax=Niallia taxi TaxID=2499688 RepID=UPI003D2E3825